MSCKMATNGYEEGDVHSGSNESLDEDLAMYRKDACNVVNFKIVQKESDLEINPRKFPCFRPEMAHQIFGENECIFGYRQLKIGLYYLHNSANCYFDFKYSGQIESDDSTYTPDNVKYLIDPWLPKGYTCDKDEFINKIKEESHDQMFGKVMHSFKAENESLTFSGEKHLCEYKITECDTSEPGFKEFHERFETYLTWFIDGANPIDLNDLHWKVFYLYEEYVADNEKIVRSPVGLCTIYEFFSYPSSIRARISQFFILPTHQRRGLAKHFYTTLYKHLRGNEKISDITVEEPTPIFQKIRDYCDCIQVWDELKKHDIQMNDWASNKLKNCSNLFKLCKKQTLRVIDILKCIKAQEIGHGEYKNYVAEIKKRITKEINKNCMPSKKMKISENVDPLNADNLSLIESDHKKYMESLEWPINRLKERFACLES